MAKETTREQILALQQAMQADQKNVAKELVESIAGEELRPFLEKLQSLRDRTIPGSTLDQQIAGVMGQIGSLGQIGAQLYQHLVQEEARAAQG